MRNLFILFFLFLFAFQSTAQDKHFSQFYSSPLTLNPALTGAYNGRYRLATIYRDQWRSVVDNPFITFAAELDVRFDLNTNSQYKDGLGLGLVFFKDNVSGIDFSTQQIALSGAYHKGLDYDNRQFLTIGLQGSINQRNVNYEQLTFGDQFNGIDGYTFATDEDLPANNFSFGDLSFGINYAFNPKPRTSLYVGFAMHHFLQPQISFYKEALDDDGFPIGNEKLYPRISTQLNAQLPVNDAFSIMPRILFATQGAHLEINAGTNVRFLLNDYTSNSLYLGGYIRPVANEDNQMGIDALVFLVGLEVGSFLFGVSYDANFSDLTTYRQGQGAFEISITHLGNFEDDSILCPKF